MEEGCRDIPRRKLQFHPHFTLSAGRRVPRSLRPARPVRRTGGAVLLGWTRRERVHQERPHRTNRSSNVSHKPTWKRCKGIRTIRPSLCGRWRTSRPGVRSSPAYIRPFEKADPTRPSTFHDQCWGNENNRGSKEMPIAVVHYPGFEGPADVRSRVAARPFRRVLPPRIVQPPRNRDRSRPARHLGTGPRFDVGENANGARLFRRRDLVGHRRHLLPAQRRDGRLRHLGPHRRLAADEARVLAHEESLFAGADVCHVRARSNGRTNPCDWKWKIGTTSPT